MKRAAVIGVVGGSGGVGASVLAAAVCVRAAAAGRPSACVDGDEVGGGLDVTFGLEQEPGLRWPDLASARGRVDGRELVARLPCVEGVGVVSFDRARPVALPHEPARQVLAALAEVVEVLVVDLTRPGTPAFDCLCPAVDLIVVLGGSGVRQLAALSAVAPLLAARCDDLWLCLRGPARNGLATTVASLLDLPCLGVVGEEPRLDADLLHGIPPGAHRRGPLAAAADRILAQALFAAATVAS